MGSCPCHVRGRSCRDSSTCVASFASILHALQAKSSSDKPRRFGPGAKSSSLRRKSASQRSWLLRWSCCRCHPTFNILLKASRLYRSGWSTTCLGPARRAYLRFQRWIRSPSLRSFSSSTRAFHRPRCCLTAGRAAVLGNISGWVAVQFLVLGHTPTASTRWRASQRAPTLFCLQTST